MCKYKCGCNSMSSISVSSTSSPLRKVIVKDWSNVISNISKISDDENTNKVCNDTWILEYVNLTY